MQPSSARHQTPHTARRGGSLLERGHEALQRNEWADAARLLAKGTQGLSCTAIDWLALAVARWKTADMDGCVDASSRALALDPVNVTARMVLTQALITLHRFDEAIDAFQSAPEDTPRDHNFHVNHGIALLRSGRAKEAVGPLMEALAQKMDFDLAYTTLGTAFKNLKLYEEAVECFRTAAALDPDNVLAHAFVAHMDQFACRWEQFDSNRTNLLGAIRRASLNRADQGAETTPFALVALPHDPADFLAATRLEAQRIQRDVTPFQPRDLHKNGDRRLRIGYLSGDFHQHATAMLITEALECRNTDQFEVTLYCHSPEDHSSARARLRKACEHFVEVHHLTPKQIAERVRSDGIDIFVDLKGYTNGNRFSSFAYRPAPIQVTWLGFPGTTGTSFVDYIIGDPVVTPLEHAAHYSEKVAQMGVCYQPNDRSRPKPKPTSRSEVGLPGSAFVYACFNQCYKITPEVFGVWMRILHQTPNSVLWLLYGGEQSKENLRKEAQARGINPERLIFAAPLAPEEHLTRLSMADLVLDTWPCNAHTTASDALWAGVPLLTLRQEVFASRVASSLLSAMDLNTLISKSAQEYEARAVELSQRPEHLAEIRKHLLSAVSRGEIFNGSRFAAELEDLYVQMWERASAGLPPDHIAIKRAHQSVKSL